MIGRTYEVFVNGKPIKLVGSTVRSLTERQYEYRKRFGLSVELRLIREVPYPEGYTAKEFDFRLKAAETFDIIAKNTFVEDGGLNIFSPIVQAFDHTMLESERGRIGGKLGGKIGGKIIGPKRGQQAKESGQIQSLGKIWGPINGRKVPIAQRRENGRKGGLVTLAKGTLGKGITPESQQRAYRNGIGKMTQKERRESGCKAVSVLLAKNPKGNGPRTCCLRWNIRRGKPCICGFHESEF